MKKFVVFAASGLAAIALAGVGVAATTEGATASVTIANTAIQISVDRGLAFGTVIPDGGDESITIAPDGTRTQEGGGVLGGTPTSARFVATGTPTRSVAITLPATVDLTGPTGEVLTVNSFTAAEDGGGTAVQPAGGTDYTGTVPDNGQLALTVGGTLAFGGRPPVGDYTGTVPVSIDYN